MSIEKVREEFRKFGIADRIMELELSSATVELASVALGVIPARIAKTLSFAVNDGAVLIVTAGDAKIDNKKYKAFFKTKAKMLTPEEAEEKIGHQVGGVCPFAVNDGVKVYIDNSVKRFKTVFPACGSSNSTIEMTPQELYMYSGAEQWTDICKEWESVKEGI